MDPVTAPVLEYFKLFGVGAGVFFILWLWLKEKKDEIKELKAEIKRRDDLEEARSKEWVTRLQEVNDLRHQEALRGFDVVQSSTEAVRTNSEILHSAISLISDVRNYLGELRS